jgi:hypothetical protein
MAFGGFLLVQACPIMREWTVFDYSAIVRRRRWDDRSGSPLFRSQETTALPLRRVWTSYLV